MTVTNNYKIIKSVAIGSQENDTGKYSRSIIKPANITTKTFKDDLKSFGGLSLRQATALINTSMVPNELYSSDSRTDRPYGSDTGTNIGSNETLNVELVDSNGSATIGKRSTMKYFYPYYDDMHPTLGWYSYIDKGTNRDWNYYKDIPAWTNTYSLYGFADTMISLVIGKGDTTPEAPSNYKLDDMVTSLECVQSGGRQNGSIYYKNVKNISDTNLIIKEVGLVCCFLNFLIPSQPDSSIYDAYAQQIEHFFDTVNGYPQGTTQISYKSSYDAFGIPMLIARVVLQTPITIAPNETKTIYYQFFEE